MILEDRLARETTGDVFFDTFNRGRYATYGTFATHLQKDLHLGAGMVAMPIAIANLMAFMASGFWGYVADVLGRR